jgi:ribA/ribD-fused uncharacterized protein
MERITSFTGKYRFLSNFYTGDDGFCSENEYQASKTENPDLKFRILTAKTPQEAKKLAKGLPRPVNALEIMKKLLKFKFYAHDLKQMLLDTGDAELIEGNWWGDTFWGQCPVGTGENHLGKLLMQVREELRKT